MPVCLFVLSQYRLVAWTLKLRSRLKSGRSMNAMSVDEQKRQALARPAPPPPPPVERSQWHAPFACVGVDHTGHFHVCQEDGEKQKSLHMSVCLHRHESGVTSKPWTSLTATSFLMCLRRLAATHGTPRVLLSDNHRTFLATEQFSP